MHSAVHKTNLKRAVISRETFEALTFSVHAVAPGLAVTGTLRLGAVGSLPAWLTSAATHFRAVVSMTVAEGLRSHITCDLCAATSRVATTLISQG